MHVVIKFCLLIFGSYKWGKHYCAACASRRATYTVLEHGWLHSATGQRIKNQKKLSHTGKEEVCEMLFHMWLNEMLDPVNI